MRPIIRKLVELLNQEIELTEPIYEFGSYQVPGQEDRSIRSFFSNRQFVGCDLQLGPGVDKIMDLHSLNLSDNSVGTAILLDTIEHVKYFWKAAPEIYRVLKPDGIAIISSVMYFPIHNYPSDYWRFTPDGFQSMTEMFDDSLVEYAGLKDFPHTVIAICTKGKLSERKKMTLKKTLTKWKQHHSHSWRELLIIFLPPALVPTLYKFYTFLTKQLSKNAGHFRNT